MTDKFDGNDNVSYMTHTRNMSHASDSGIGNGGAIIYNTYDDDEIMREALESPTMPAMDTPAQHPHNMHQKRPSLELDLNGNALNEARSTQPNTPEPVKGGDYVMNGQGHGLGTGTRVSGKQVVDMSPINTELNETNARPSRTPTPVADADAEILVEETSGCSCFGWFGRKKKKVGLAQQELR